MRELAAEHARHSVGEHPSVLRVLREPLVLQLAGFACLTIGGYMAFQLIAPQLLISATGMDIRHVGYLISGAGVMTMLGMLASGWHSDRIGSRFGHLLGSTLMVALCFAFMAAATGPAMMITAFLAMSVFWPAVTLSTNLVLTEVVPCRLVPVAAAGVNTLAQLGAFAMPILWGISKDATGSYNFGLALVPLVFVAAAAVGLHVRHQVRRNQRIVAAAAVAA
jgi:predicted MFS family arabinose efflux permease